MGVDSVRVFTKKVVYHVFTQKIFLCSPMFTIFFVFSKAHQKILFPPFVEQPPLSYDHPLVGGCRLGGAYDPPNL